MPNCQICRSDIPRRRRNPQSNLLVCWSCDRRLMNVIGTAREVSRLEEQIEGYRRTRPILPNGTEYKFNSPYSAIPPKDILERSILALDMAHIYSDFSIVLGDHYGFEAPRYLDKPEEVPKGAIACYHNFKNVVYAAKGPMSRHTAFHEFWHALENHGTVPRTIDSEKNANTYASACLKRLAHKGDYVHE